MKRTRLLVVSTVLMGLASYAVLAQTEPVLPRAEAERMIDADAQFIKEVVNKMPELGRKSARQVGSAAVLIAAAAQASMTKENAQQMATLRDKAIALAHAAEKTDTAKAKELAGQLSSKIQADSSAKPKVASWTDLAGLDLVMRAYSSDRVGGLGLEARLDALADEEGAVSAEKQKEALDLAYKTVAISHIAGDYKPTSDEGGGFNPQNWLKFNDELRKNALALADAAKTNKGVGPAAEKLSGTCISCHDIFR